MGFLTPPPASLPWALNSPGSPPPGPFCVNPLPVCCHCLQTTASSRVGTVSASPPPSAPGTVVDAPLLQGIWHSAVPPGAGLATGSQQPESGQPLPLRQHRWPHEAEAGRGGAAGDQRGALRLLNFMATLVSRNGKDRRFRRPVNVTVMDFPPAPAGPRLLSLLLLWLESDWPGTRKRRTERGCVP